MSTIDISQIIVLIDPIEIQARYRFIQGILGFIASLSIFMYIQLDLEPNANEL